MSADDLRVQFLTDVIIPLCDQYGKDDKEGWRVYNDAYYAHRRQYGSFALCPDREARMQERVGFMMVQFFKWLYTSEQGISSPRLYETAHGNYPGHRR